MLATTLEQISVAGARGRPRARPDRLIADKGYPWKANRGWLRRHGIAATIPERADQITHRRRRYRGRNVVQRCFNRLKQWRGIAMRSDKYARNYHAGLSLAAALHWLADIL
ncbi:Mobile element protein [Micrococcus lylae]|uniref:Mobile element protein n=1 Tax=Micrococcus lylae TaxID=1273 RepID=A0A1R4JW15_9MICC|nr:Mobile element protein [Micrococcus lylae]